MDYYKSQETVHEELAHRKKRKRLIFMACLIAGVLIMAGGAGRLLWDRYHQKEIPAATGATTGKTVDRVSDEVKSSATIPRSITSPGVMDILATAVLRRTPSLYALIIEKNGKDFQLTPGDAFEVSYRDEFVIKKAVTDALIESRVTASIVGMENPVGSGSLVKGIFLVDKVMAAESDPSHHKSHPAFSIVVKYYEKKISEIPIQVLITPQDWLRVAKNANAESSLQVESLKKAVELSPKDLSVRHMLADAYEKKGMTDQAVAQYRQILRQKPGDMKALINESSLLFDQQQYEDALALYQKIISYNPKDASALANAGLSASKINKWQDAAAYYAASLKIKPDNAPIILRSAEALEKSGKTDRAAEQYRAYLKYKANDLEAMATLGDMYMKGKRYDEAIGVFSEIVLKDTKNAAAYVQLGLAYGAKGKNKEELESYKKAVSLKSNNYVIHYNLAVALANAKRYAEAITEYNQVLKLKPDDADSLLNLGDLYVRDKKYTKAISMYEKALRVTPGKDKARCGAIHAGLGYAYGEAKQYKQAAAHYEKAMSLGMKDASVVNSLRAIYEKLGDKKKTLSTSERGAASNQTLETLSTLADEYMKQKKYDKAIKTYEKMARISPKKASLYAGLGYAYHLKGDLDKEIENYQTALKYDKEDDATYTNLGAAYEKKGLYSDALDAYKAAYEINPESKAAKKIPELKIKLLQQKHSKD